MAIVDKSTNYFNATLYTGNASSPRTISGVGFSPDLVWNKCIDGGDHRLLDQVRGANKEFAPNRTLAEFSNNSDGNLTAFTSDGFTITAGSTNINNWNKSSDGYVSWDWKANGSGSSNTAGSINSTVSVNTESGCSIVTYSGTNGTATVGHGLGTKPNWIWCKALSAVKNNTVYHSSLGATKSVYLDETSAATTSYDYWADTEPTSTVFTVKKDGSYDETNGSGINYVAYCFSERPGFSKMSEYTGNGSADGTFVYTGFKPAFVMNKKTDGTMDWHIWDNKRNPFNVINTLLYPNLSNAADTLTSLDFVSNGFKIRDSRNFINANGSPYIYMAFAENPFVTSTGNGSIPGTAR